MSNENQKVFLTVQQAIECLNDSEIIHTFSNPRNSFLLGADVDRQKIIKLFNENPNNIEIGGENCRSLKHGIVITPKNEFPVFIEANEEKLKKFDKSNILKDH